MSKDGWQPIAEAPADGTEILLWWPGAEYAPVASWECFEGGEEDGTGSMWGWCLKHEGSLLCPGEYEGWLVFEEDPKPTLWCHPPQDTGTKGQDDA